MDEPFSGAINSPDYWNKRFFEDWINRGGRRQTAFFAELCVRELPQWLIEAVSADRSSIFDYGCALGDALPVWQRRFPHSVVGGGDVAQVGLGLARALNPQFSFADVNAVADGTPLADLVYCSNTLEHFTGWRAVLDRLARHAGRYVVVVVPFEEAEPIDDEHATTFEFDSLPARLPGGHRLLHLTIVDAAAEPETQWNGQQLIAIYGKAARPRARSSAVSHQRENAMAFDLREATLSAIPPLLANLASMSQRRRRVLAELAAAQAEKMQLAAERAKAADRVVVLEVTLKGMLREYRDIARGLEAAQGWVVDRLAERDAALLHDRDIPPVAEEWPAASDDDDGGHRVTIARLIDAAHRGNRLALALLDEVGHWQDERRRLTERLQRARQALERAVGAHDRMRNPLPRPREATIGETGPLVSIVLPVFNHSYLVEEAIAGVLEQTYRNWELLIVDDGSTDDLADRVRRYAGERRILFLRQPNQRLPAALNHGFAWARGELLTWTSADNILLPGQLARLVAELQAHPEAGLVYSDYWAIDDKGEPLEDALWRHHNRDPEIADLIRLPDRVTIDNFHKSGDNFIGPSFLYRRVVADIVGSYADDAFGGEDFDFWLRMHLVTEFRHVAEPLYKYRVHADTLTTRAEDLRLFDNIGELLEADRWRIETLLDDAGLGDGGLQRGAALLRPTDQFHAVVLQRCRPVAYHDFVGFDAAATAQRPLVVDVDASARMMDLGALHAADLLLCRSELVAAMLRREDWAHNKRILTWQGEPTAAVHHAYIQAFADQVTSPVTTPVRRVPARPDAAFRPTRILLLVDRWSAGGMENIAADLAENLAAGGRTVIVAAAQGAAPPAAAFGDAGIHRMTFGGDESAFEALLRREAIEIVNYHHSRFAVAAVKALDIATVYTMQNCYLWMDDRERAEVAAGLRDMDQVIAVSRQVAQFAATQFGVPPGRLSLIPNALRASIARPAARPAATPDTPFIVAMVASINRHKLQHVAIAGFEDAAAAIPAMRLRLIGQPLDPQYLSELEAQIAASPLRERIELVGGLSRGQTLTALAGAHVFLLPSLVEGCSVALLEAAAAGCVCIASDVGAARDLVGIGGSVILLPSPLGELERVTQREFLAAANALLPQHRANIADALRTAWNDYGAFAAGADDTSARVRELADFGMMTEAYLDAYTLAGRGGIPHRQSAQRSAALARA
jgi:glycosyltransferase involved in cell wall biosynthesis